MDEKVSCGEWNETMVDVKPESAQLRAMALALHRDMTTMGDSLFLPTGGAFLSISNERLQQLIDEPSIEMRNEDAFNIYAQWHEGVHMAQLVASPYLLPRVSMIAKTCRLAQQRVENPNSDGMTLFDLSRAYDSIWSDLTKSYGGVSVLDIIETQAVTQGLRWMMPNNDGDSIGSVADLFYRDEAPHYLKLIDIVRKRFGNEVAMRLLPKLCFLALQSWDPCTHLSNLLRRLDREVSPMDFCDYSSIKICEWASADISLVTMSLRERAKTLSAQDAQKFGVGDDPWFLLLDQYYIDFEAISLTDERLDLLMGVKGGYSFPLFAPLFTVFGNGDVRLRCRSTFEQEEKELRVSGTLDLIKGLRAMKEHSTAGGGH